MFAITSEFWQQSLQNRGRDAVVVASGIEEVEGRLLKSYFPEFIHLVWIFTV